MAQIYYFIFYLQIFFHNFYPLSEKRVKEIAEELEKLRNFGR